MAEALVKGRALRQARERADLSVDTLARRIGTKTTNVESWENEEKLPTFRQALRLAEVTNVPFGYLYLEELPADDVDLPDLRTVGGEPPPPLSADTIDLIKDIEFKFDWYREYLAENGAEDLPFVASFTRNHPPEEVARDIQQKLKTEELRVKSRNTDEYLRAMMLQAENIGIWVMRSGIVGNNTSRPLSVNQFRGLAIADKIAPLIFINGKDALAAQIFTLAHELAHIWIGSTGISNLPVTRPAPDANPAEVFCNAVAAEVLVPANTFMQRWNAALSIEDNATTLATLFKVSRIVIVRRALERNRITQRAYQTFATQEAQRWEAQQEKESSGGNFYLTQNVRFGRRFVNAVTSAAANGNLMLRRAAQLLNTRPSVILKTYRQAQESE